jgi:hypothetical protein
LCFSVFVANKHFGEDIFIRYSTNLKSMKTLLYFLLLLLALGIDASATVLHVPSQYTTIQGAINAASTGDTILVSPGIYYENLNIRAKGIILASNYLLTRDTLYIGNTVINGSQPVLPDSASCVIMASKFSSTTQDSTAAVIGFTITGGTGTKWEDEHNPGSVYREGGAILIQYLSPRIEFNRIMNNDATNKTGCVSAGGGGIRCGDGDPKIRNNVIAGNAGRYGGGIVLNFAGAVIRNNVIAGNSGGEDYGGGGIWAYGNDALSRPKIIENNTIINNASTTKGGGILCWSTPMTVACNILWGNTAPTGPQISAISTGQLTVAYSDVQGGFIGTGNTDTLPGFGPENYFLSTGSPCIDAGDPNTYLDDPEDPANPGSALFPALGTLSNDMGAYGGPGSRIIGSIPTVYTGMQNPGRETLQRTLIVTPVPATDQATVHYFLPGPAVISIRIVDFLGKDKIEIASGPAETGSHSVTIPVKELAPGIYFCIMQSTGSPAIIKKLIVSR